jgi:hypothetical protein
MYTLVYVLRFDRAELEDGPRLFEFEILGLGPCLPGAIQIGNNSKSLIWYWRPQIYFLKVLREQTNIRYENHRFGNYLRPNLWSLWLLYRLARNGINPFRGLISGRKAIVLISTDEGTPNLSKSDASLMIMRSAGKSGLLLNDYSTFLEVKLMRKGTYSVITDFSAKSIPKGFSRRLSFLCAIKSAPFVIDLNIKKKLLREFSQIFPDWHPYSYLCRGKNALVIKNVTSVPQRKIGHNLVFDAKSIILRNGKTLENSGYLIDQFGEENTSKNRVWPKYTWVYQDSDKAQTPGGLSGWNVESATYLSAVNNLYHFIEETLPQIAINNLFSPMNPIFVGGNLDSILQELATLSSTSSVNFVRDEETFFFQDLKFFHLEKFRSSLSQGKHLTMDEQVDLINAGLSEIVSIRSNESQLTTKIYIVRRKGLQRQLANIRSVRNILEKQGFLFVDFEPLSLSERIELLSNCSILIGESGAGLANAYFLRPEAKVVEIRHTSMQNSCEHLTLAQATRVEYIVLEGSGTSRIEKFMHGNDSFKIDLNMLKKLIEEL